MDEIAGLIGPPSWPHQTEAIAFARQHRGTMIGVGMGGGKGRIVVGRVASDPDIRRVLIVCPHSVIPVWPAQFATHTDIPIRVVALDTGTIKQRTAVADAALRVSESAGGRTCFVINYDAARSEPFASWATGLTWDLVVMDESAHRGGIKAPGGVTSMWARRLRASAVNRMCLTGTPLPKGLEDAYGQYRFLDPNIFGTSYVQFRRRYCKLGGPSLNWITGYQNVEDFNARFHRIAYVVDQSTVDAAAGLGTFEDVERFPVMNEKARGAYQSIERDLYAEVENGTITAANALVKLLRLQQITGGVIPLDEGGSVTVDTSKAQALGDALEEMQGEPVVVFARFTADLDAISDKAQDLGLHYRELSGRCNDLAEWQQGAGTVLGVNIAAGGVGIDLTRARYCVMYSVGWSLGDLLQARKRVHRPGQTRPVTYVWLTSKGTVDETIRKALEARKDLVEEALRRRP